MDYTVKYLDGILFNKIEQEIGILVEINNELYFLPDYDRKLVEEHKYSLEYLKENVLEKIDDLSVLLNDSIFRVANEHEKMMYLCSHFPSTRGKIVERFNIDGVRSIQILKVLRDDGEIRYYTFVNYKDLHTSFDTFEKAIVGAIARKYDGVNTKADVYFWKMIG